MSLLDPTHPDVAPVLDLLDECDACGGSGKPRALLRGELVIIGVVQCSGDALCAACSGTGKALHPDRVAMSVGRWILRAPSGRRILIDAVRDDAGPWDGFFMCRVARAVKEAQ